MKQRGKILTFLTFLVFFVSAVTCASHGKVALQDDPPVTEKPTAGVITGQIGPDDLIDAKTNGKNKKLRAVSRATGKVYWPENFDTKTGLFEFSKLPGDAAYDICFTTNTGRDIEGIDLEFVDARLARLAAMRREKLSQPTTQEKTSPELQNSREKIQKISAEDVKAIEKFVAGWQDFLDTRRILYIRGQGNFATVLVELMRTREFHKSRKPGQAEGEIIWRIELWYMQKQDSCWVRLANVERLLRRERTSPSQWRKISVEYYPQLTARIDSAGLCKPVHFKIPTRPDPTRGRPANTKINLKTKPHIMSMGN